mgnify:CR=1 FL=1
MLVDKVEFLDARLYSNVRGGLVVVDGQITISTPMWVGNIDDVYIAVLVFGFARDKVIKRLVFDLLDNELFTVTNCSIISTDYATFDVEDDCLGVTLDISMQEKSLKDWLPFTRNLYNDYLEISNNFRKGIAQRANLVYFNNRNYLRGATEEDVKHSFDKVVSAWCYKYILDSREKVTDTPCLYTEDGAVFMRLPVKSVKIASMIKSTNSPEPPTLDCECGELVFI